MIKMDDRTFFPLFFFPLKVGDESIYMSSIYHVTVIK